MARVWAEQITTEASKFKRKGEDIDIPKITGTVKVGLEADGIVLRVSSSPTLEWHMESGDVENGASAKLTKEQSQWLRSRLEKAEQEL